MNYKRIIKNFKNFCRIKNLLNNSISPLIICKFVECQVSSRSTVNSVLNIFSALKFYSKLLKLDDSVWKDRNLLWYVKGVKSSLPLAIKKKEVISPKMFKKLCLSLESEGSNGLALKCACILGYFGMLRVSNVAPSTTRKFNKTENTLKRDVRVFNSGVSIRLKWSKSRKNCTPIFVNLPKISDEVVDPVSNFVNYFKGNKFICKNKPVLLFSDGVHMSRCYISRIFKLHMKQLFPCSNFTFHDLRRSSATNVFKYGGSSLAIAKQGTWKSLVYLDYIICNSSKNCQLQTQFEKMFIV